MKEYTVFKCSQCFLSSDVYSQSLSIPPSSYCCYLVVRLCPSLCNPLDYSTAAFSVHGISQAQSLEWLSLPSPGDLPDPRIQPTSPALAGRFFTTELPGKPLHQVVETTPLLELGGSYLLILTTNRVRKKQGCVIEFRP